MTTPRIMIVEDERIIALDLAQSIRGWGYEVLGPISDGREAIVQAGLHRPDLIVMDINLHGPLDGIAAAKQIQRAYSISSLFLTAYSESSVFERAEDAEPVGYLRKPFEPAELRGMLARVFTSRAHT